MISTRGRFTMALLKPAASGWRLPGRGPPGRPGRQPHPLKPAELMNRRLVESLDDHRHTLAAANAHGFQADGLVAGDQAVEQGGGDPGAGHAERVAQRDGTAVHVEPVDVDA